MDFLPFLIEEIRKALDSSRSEVRLAILGFFFFLFICFIIYRALEVVRRRRLLDVLGELASQTGLQLTPARSRTVPRAFSFPRLKGLYRGRSVSLSVDKAASAGNASGGRLRYTRVRLELDNPGDCCLDIRPKSPFAGMFQTKQAISADSGFDRRLQFQGSPPNFLRRAVQLAPRYPILLGRDDGVTMPATWFLARARRLPTIHLENSSLEYVQPGIPGDPYVELSVLNFLSELADLAELEAADHQVFQPAPLKKVPSPLPAPIGSRRRRAASDASLRPILLALYVIVPILIWILFALPELGEGPRPTGLPPVVDAGGIQETQIASMRSTDVARFVTTATAQVVAGAGARATGAAMIRSTYTARAVATDQSRKKLYVTTFEASKQNPDGPYSGSLKHDPSDGPMELRALPRRLKNFAAQATFLNPYSASETGRWAYGFVFRDDSVHQQHYRLVLKSTGYWELRSSYGGLQSTLAAGRLPQLNTDKNGSNKVWLMVKDDKGLFFVNEAYVSDFELSSLNLDAGQIAVATGMDRGTEIEGYSTGYQDFMVWALP